MMAVASAEMQVIRVSPGELHKCADAARAIAASVDSAPSVLRCELKGGSYTDDLDISNVGVPVEIIGAGKQATVMEGSAPVTGVKWEPWSNPNPKRTRNTR